MRIRGRAMKDRYPRTVAEFADHGMRVVVICDDCTCQRTVPPDVLSLTFGDDFDCYSSLIELQLQLRCECCGQRRRRIRLVDVMDLGREAAALRQPSGSAPRKSVA